MRWVIGDIHGMLKPLDALLNEIRRRDPSARPIFVGDYVNRGPDSPGVIERMLSLNNAVFLRGNHDDIFDLILNDASYIAAGEPFDPLSAFVAFMNHGLDATLCAYGADLAELRQLQEHPERHRLRAVLKVVPPAHRAFFRSLRAVAEFDTFFVAHASWNPDDGDRSPDLAARLTADVRLRYQLLWGRYAEPQLLKKKRWQRTGYFGHTPVSNYRKDPPFLPYFGANIVMVDTGAALSANGRLTAVCPDNGQVVQSDRAGQIIPP